jgi:hypothetical protein
MARSTIKFLKQQGQFNTRIASLVGCDRHTVARVLTEPTDPPRRRQRASALEPQRPAVLSWIAEDIPATRMLELVRQDRLRPTPGVSPPSIASWRECGPTGTRARRR